jgi:hypothetical protein
MFRFFSPITGFAHRPLRSFALPGSLFLAISFPHSLAAENPELAANGTMSDTKLSATIQTILRNSEAAAVGIAMEYLKPLNNTEIYNFTCSKPKLGNLCPSAVSYRFAPTLNLQAGENGSFQAIVAKLSGEFIYGRSAPKDDNGDSVSNNRTRHMFPVSLGMSTTRYANNVSLLGEVGYVPYNPNFGQIGDQVLQLGFNPYFGIFFQGGYKFHRANKPLTGGSRDQSSERGNDKLLRLKANFRFALELPKAPILGDRLSSRLITWATGWFDIANNDIYHSVGAILRFNLPGQKKTSFDIKFENGSGEPNFNQGSQFGAGLTIAF